MVNTQFFSDEEKANDAYELLMSSFRVDEEVKSLLQEKAFLEQNPDIIINLARLLFLVDSIIIEKNEIVARKSVARITEPEIPVDDIIYKYLIKIKYDTLSKTDIERLNELKQYPSYVTLYNLLRQAIDQKVKVQKVTNDVDLKMSIIDLETFLSNG